jgi:hypothetical protein
MGGGNGSGGGDSGRWGNAGGGYNGGGGGNGNGSGYSSSGAAAAGNSAANGNGAGVSPFLEWGSDWAEDWDPEDDLDQNTRAALADEAEAAVEAGRRTPQGTPRDKWITPLLDFRAVAGAVDPDQARPGRGGAGQSRL